MDRRPEERAVPRRCEAVADSRWIGRGRREGGQRLFRFRAGRYVCELLHRKGGCSERNQDSGTSIAADLSLARTVGKRGGDHAGERPTRRLPPAGDCPSRRRRADQKSGFSAVGTWASLPFEK